MSHILADKMKDSALLDYDAFMMEAFITLKDIPDLAVEIWKDVLNELGRRGKIRLISGSFDDPGNALIDRPK